MENISSMSLGRLVRLSADIIKVGMFRPLMWVAGLMSSFFWGGWLCAGCSLPFFYASVVMFSMRDERGELRWAVYNLTTHSPPVMTFFMGLVLLAVALALRIYTDWRHDRMILRNFSNTVPQAFKPESPYFDVKHERSQFAIYASTTRFEHDSYLVGHGFRYKNHLIVPVHVLGARLKGKSIVYRRPGEDSPVLIEPVDNLTWTEILPDVAAAKLSSRSPCCQIPTGKIGPLWGKHLATVSTYFHQDNASLGFLEDAGFGVFSYTGSTRPGFSGAVYVIDGRIVAMHSGGGPVNVAHSASYIETYLFRAEASPDAGMQRLLKRARRKDWEAVQVSPDEYQLRIFGRYYVVDKETFHRLMIERGEEDEYETEADRIDAGEGGNRRQGRRAARRAGHAAAERMGKLDYWEPEANSPPESVSENDSVSQVGSASAVTSGTRSQSSSILSDHSQKSSLMKQLLDGQQETNKQLSTLSASITRFVEQQLLQQSQQLKKQTAPAQPLPETIQSAAPPAQPQLKRILCPRCASGGVICEILYATKKERADLLKSHYAKKHVAKSSASEKQPKTTSIKRLPEQSVPSTSKAPQALVVSDGTKTSAPPSGGTELNAEIKQIYGVLEKLLKQSSPLSSELKKDLEQTTSA